MEAELCSTAKDYFCGEGLLFATDLLSFALSILWRKAREWQQKPWAAGAALQKSRCTWLLSISLVSVAFSTPSLALSFTSAVDCIALLSPLSDRGCSTVNVTPRPSVRYFNSCLNLNTGWPCWTHGTTPMPAANTLRSDGLEAQVKEEEYFHLLRILPLPTGHGPT